MRLAARTSKIDSSGIRKVFNLAAKLKDPVNLSIGQPDFDVPETVKKAAIEAILAGKNKYTLTQGTQALRDKVRETLAASRDGVGHPIREIPVGGHGDGGIVIHPHLEHPPLALEGRRTEESRQTLGLQRG